MNEAAVAVIGHNQGPSQTIFERLAEDHANLHDAVANLAGRADTAPRAIKELGDFSVVGALIMDARTLSKQIDQRRVAEKEPFLIGGREVDAFFKIMTDRLGRIVQVFQKIADDHQRAVAAEARRKAEEEAKRARAEEAERIRKAEEAKAANRDRNSAQHLAKAEAAGFAAERAEAAASAQAADLTRTRLDSGVLATSREAWTFEVTDYSAIDLNSLRPYFKRDAVEMAVRMAIKMGARDIRGTRIFEDVKASFR